jgi:hypothetical protein
MALYNDFLFLGMTSNVNIQYVTMNVNISVIWSLTMHMNQWCAVFRALLAARKFTITNIQISIRIWCKESSTKEVTDCMCLQHTILPSLSIAVGWTAEQLGFDSWQRQETGSEGHAVLY